MIVIIATLLLCRVFAYFEIELFRRQGVLVTSNIQSQWLTTHCTNSADTEPCYFKDIVYTMHLLYEHRVYGISADLTSPLGWIKGNTCHLADEQMTRCRLTQESMAQGISSSFSDIGTRLSNLRRREARQVTYNKEIGSMQKIRGTLEKDKELRMATVDSNRYGSLLKILGVGLFLEGEKDEIKLQHTNYINATIIDPLLSDLSDGAVSLRFDTDSENSFLNEMFGAVNQDEMSVTIFIGDNSYLTMGEIAEKRAVGGSEGIQWVDLENKNHFDLKSVGIHDEDEEELEMKVEVPAYLTLSASYLSFPSPHVEKLSKQLSKYKCKKTVNGLIECDNANKELLEKTLVLKVGDLKLSYKLKDLVRVKRHSSVVLNIRNSDSDVVILGEPHFKAYFTVFDYRKNRMGFAYKFHIPEDTVVTDVTMVRFLVFCLALGNPALTQAAS